MASIANEKRKHIFSKVVPKLKIRSSNKAKKEKKTELSLEAASISRNFDPETYIIPLQNRWTFESHLQRSIISSENQSFDQSKSFDQSTAGSNDNLIFTSSDLNSKTLQSSGDTKTHTLQSSAKDKRKTQKSSREEDGKKLKTKSSKYGRAALDLDNIGYVPSHPLQRQRHLEKNNESSLLSNSMNVPGINTIHDEDYDYDDYDYDDYDDYEDRKMIENKHHESIKRISSLPGTVQTDSDNHYNEVSDLDIDRVQLVAESDDDDDDDGDWSVHTPSLPPLSATSSDEPINHDFDQSSQSDLHYSIKSKSNNNSVNRVDVSNTYLLKSIITQIEEQRQLINRKNQISDRKEAATRKQRTKDLKLVDQRFSRLESHVITLARSVAHLSAELRSQNKIRQNISTLQKEVYELSMRRNNELKYLQEKLRIIELDRITQKRIRKLRKFFGDDPGRPLLDKFLERIGYEEYSSLFQKERIGLMELPYLNEEQLINLGIPLGPTTRIIENAKHLY